MNKLLPNHFAALGAIAIAAILALASTSGLSAKEDDKSSIRASTLAWVDGWRTSPEKPFNLDEFAHLYAQDESFSSLDFGRPFDGFTDWKSAAAYYRKFMQVPKSWRLTPNGEMNITIRGNIAWSTLPLKAAGSLDDGTKIDLPEARVTLIFEKRDGKWLIVHEHGSSAVPFPSKGALKQMLN